MSLMDDAMRHVPDYYDYMYLDGFTPDEIMYAARKKMNRDLELRKQKQREALLEKILEKEIEKQLESIIKKVFNELLDGFNK